MKTVEINIYEFDELAEDIKQVVLDRHREINVDDTWYDPIYEGLKEEAQEAGFEVKDIMYSGFWFQGDGAMFTYTGLDKKILEQAVDTLKIPDWKKRILKNGYISGTGTHQGHYYHEYSCNHAIHIETDNGMQYYKNIENLFEVHHTDIENYVIEIYKGLCKDLYKSLSKYYDELTDDEYVRDTILMNEYTFTEDGSIFN